MHWMTRAVESVGLALACLVTAPAFAQSQDLDSPSADPAHHKVELENGEVRVVRYVIEPHGKTALHGHPSLVNVLLTDADARATAPDGKASEIHGKAGSVAWRGPTVHVVENVADRRLEGLLVEPKGPGNAAWTPPALDSSKVDPAHHRVELENDQVRVERYWYPKGERSPMHDHAANVQIVLTDSDALLSTPDGKVTESHSKAGQVRYRSFVNHVVENTGERFEGFVVVLKGGAPARTGGR
jgi:quercetin dioxygenase-like cupin family protein